MLNRGVIPVVPERGSVGASGDLAPLAHLALALIGEGEAWYRQQRLRSSQALALAGLVPVVLGAKEGLALVNGTQAMCAVGALALARAERLAEIADLAGAMTLEGLLGSHKPFLPEIQEVRPHPGQRASAERLRQFLADSELVLTHEHCSKVQDPYSLRCMPQVHGAAREGIAFAHRILETEVNSATDNPLVFVDHFRRQFSRATGVVGPRRAGDVLDPIGDDQRTTGGTAGEPFPLRLAPVSGEKPGPQFRIHDRAGYLRRVGGRVSDSLAPGVGGFDTVVGGT